ncbi:MAG: N-formylglutamate amidohydrolase [Methylocystaceae bacterium]|nr:MAG: hypothetical protein FD148_675 [Methylocystaceae bacterium]KAF0210421.1 MAG: N-formylglutamate [Methylocystaceae bacterium]TXT43838.1 MAG: N-formylglutamate amidohydrolase [Methylocystaceae bacterium]
MAETHGAFEAKLRGRALGRLGVLETELARHIAWDIGVAAVSRLVADALDATLVQQNYSRLVIDCNRAPKSETSIPEISEFTPIPGNGGLSEGQKDARLRENFQPYHDRIKAAMAGGPAGGIGRDAKFYAGLHGLGAAWHADVLYNRDARFADALIAWLKGEEGLIVGDNEPYSVTDKSDYTISVPGERGLLHVEVEIRQDLIAGESGQRAWGALRARLLPQAYQEAWSSRAVLRWAMTKIG